MAKAKANFSATGIKVPDYKIIKSGMKPVSIGGIKRDYDRLMDEALWYAHYEVPKKTLKAEFLKFAATIDRDKAKELKRVPDYGFMVFGKYAYINNKGAELSDEHTEAITQGIDKLLELHPHVEEVVEEAKPEGKVVSIQDRMRQQVSDLCGQWEGYLDDWRDGEFDLKKFDPYKDMMSYQPAIKPAHAKIIQQMYEAMYREAQELVAWEDEDIKEAYSQFTGRAQDRKNLLKFYELIMTATNTVINTGKATRKTRAKKAPSQDKLVAKLKYKESDPAIGLASISPLGILGASELYVYNTKNRKLMHIISDDMTGPLSVKGTTITGFDTVKSTQRTIRKPDILKGADKLARTKFAKLYKELTTTDTTINGRINEHCVIIKAF
jgi:hypothetical protein